MLQRLAFPWPVLLIFGVILSISAFDIVLYGWADVPLRSLLGLGSGIAITAAAVVLWSLARRSPDRNASV